MASDGYHSLPQTWHLVLDYECLNQYIYDRLLQFFLDQVLVTKEEDILL